MLRSIQRSKVSSGEGLIFNVAARHQFLERIAEEIRILPVVEAPLELIAVVVEMLSRHLMKRSNNRTLELGLSD